MLLLRALLVLVVFTFATWYVYEKFEHNRPWYAIVVSLVGLVWSASILWNWFNTLVVQFHWVIFAIIWAIIALLPIWIFYKIVEKQTRWLKELASIWAYFWLTAVPVCAAYFVLQIFPGLPWEILMSIWGLSLIIGTLLYFCTWAIFVDEPCDSHGSVDANYFNVNF